MAIPFKYNLRNLVVRWITTVLTILGITCVAVVFTMINALGAGMERTLVTSGEPLNLIVLRKGSQTETNSGVSLEQAKLISVLDGIARDKDGQPMASPELMALANLPKTDGGKANIAFRGVHPMARTLRGSLKLSSGRWFEPRRGEIVVGKGAAGRFADLKPGSAPFIRGRAWSVVGIFESDGQAYESEIWADFEDVREQFKREYSSVVLRVASESAIAPLQRLLEEDRQFKLEAKRHTEYYKAQNMSGDMIKAMGGMMAVVLSIGAIFGAANTMFAAVSMRTREIATMRVLGFTRLAIWISFVLESALLGLCGGVLGSLIGYLAFNGMSTGTANWATFSELAFQFRVTPDIMVSATIMAVIMGVIGGFLPAWRASRMTIARALRGM